MSTVLVVLTDYIKSIDARDLSGVLTGGSVSSSGFLSSRRRIGFAGAGVVLTAALTLSACGSSSSGSSSSNPAVKLSLVAYSTPQAAYEQLISAFQKTPAGKNITFSQSYGASGDQSRAVASGLKADIVELLAGTRHDPAREGLAGFPELGRQPVQGQHHRLQSWCWWSARATRSTSPTGAT